MILYDSNMAEEITKPLPIFFSVYWPIFSPSIEKAKSMCYNI